MHKSLYKKCQNKRLFGINLEIINALKIEKENGNNSICIKNSLWLCLKDKKQIPLFWTAKKKEKECAIKKNISGYKKKKKKY